MCMSMVLVIVIEQVLICTDTCGLSRVLLIVTFGLSCVLLIVTEQVCSCVLIHMDCHVYWWLLQNKCSYYVLIHVDCHMCCWLLQEKPMRVIIWATYFFTLMLLSVVGCTIQLFKSPHLGLFPTFLLIGK